MDQFSHLPPDAIINIALYEPIGSIARLCQVSRRFNDIICSNNNFWRDKFILDFGLDIANEINATSWE